MFLLVPAHPGKSKGKKEYLYSAFLHQDMHKAEAWITQFYLQTTPCLPFLRGVHQMSSPQQLRQQTSNCSSLLVYRPQKDERLSWPSWLTYSGWLTHISDHPSATSRANAHRPKTNALPLDHATNLSRTKGHKTVVVVVVVVIKLDVVISELWPGFSR